MNEVYVVIKRTHVKTYYEGEQTDNLDIVGCFSTREAAEAHASQWQQPWKVEASVCAVPLDDPSFREGIY